MQLEYNLLKKLYNNGLVINLTNWLDSINKLPK